MILGAAAAMNINHLILTPFGCGSCGNPPQLVAEMLLKAIKAFPIPTVEICVLDDSGSNFKAFEECFNNASYD